MDKHGVLYWMSIVCRTVVVDDLYGVQSGEVLHLLWVTII